MPQGPSPFDTYAQPAFPYMDDTVNPQGAMPPAAPVPLPVHGPRVIPVDGENPGFLLPGPGGMGGGEQAVLQQPDRLGRNPDDVKAMRMENARRQYEQRFGMSPGGNKSMQAAGQQGELDALIARLNQARMAHMAERRTARRG
jgi:hypothetical protein